MENRKKIAKIIHKDIRKGCLVWLLVSAAVAGLVLFIDREGVWVWPVWIALTVFFTIPGIVIAILKDIMAMRAYDNALALVDPTVFANEKFQHVTGDILVGRELLVYAGRRPVFVERHTVAETHIYDDRIVFVKTDGSTFCYRSGNDNVKDRMVAWSYGKWICPQCHAVMSDDYMFCSECGHARDQGEGKPRKWHEGWIVVVLILVIIAACLVFQMRPKEEIPHDFHPQGFACAEKVNVF